MHSLHRQSIEHHVETSNNRVFAAEVVQELGDAAVLGGLVRSSGEPEDCRGRRKPIEDHFQAGQPVASATRVGRGPLWFGATDRNGRNRRRGVIRVAAAWRRLTTQAEVE